MKFRLLTMTLLFAGLFTFSTTMAEEQDRDVSVFSEISLRVPAKLYLKQGEPQSVRVEAKESVLEELITEVKGNELIIRFPGRTIFQRNFNPGKIEIYVTVPEVDGLSVSGSGDILADEIESRILNLTVSGSGNIEIKELDSKKVKGSISGSGNIKLDDGGVAEELAVTISGSGSLNAAGFEAGYVSVTTSGSGNCRISSNGSIKARIAGSGSVYYKGNPSIDASVAGSGRVKKM